MRLVVVDDHALFRDGISSLLRAWGHEVVGQAGNGSDAIQLVDQHDPDVALLDVRMPGMSGVDVARIVKERHPKTSVVMLTISEDEDDLFRAIESGAQGYLMKDLESGQFRAMLEAVGRGEAAITPATAARVLRRFVKGEADSGTAGELTDRETEVLHLVTAGLRNREIAARLGISENTVKYHIRNILERLHAKSRTELAGRAARQALR
ncbi:MAG: response regulator transcription factor [Chloroflexota bacterium]|nr:response regulator transcription factor [Chloroflexota bacterium]MDE3192088.1 response regulator transcription factor [Chloroflexota bacterium]